MPSHHLRRDGLGDVVELEMAAVGRDLRMKNHLQQQVAELVAEPVDIVALDRVRHLVRFLDRVRRDRRKILRDVPLAPGPRIAQRAHDIK